MAAWGGLGAWAGIQDVNIPSDGFFYFGEQNTNGTWRAGRSGTDLVWQLRVSGSYVTQTSKEPEGSAQKIFLTSNYA